MLTQAYSQQQLQDVFSKLYSELYPRRPVGQFESKDRLVLNMFGNLFITYNIVNYRPDIEDDYINLLKSNRKITLDSLKKLTKEELRIILFTYGEYPFIKRSDYMYDYYVFILASFCEYFDISETMYTIRSLPCIKDEFKTILRGISSRVLKDLDETTLKEIIGIDQYKYLFSIMETKRFLEQLSS